MPGLLTSQSICECSLAISAAALRRAARTTRTPSTTATPTPPTRPAITATARTARTAGAARTASPSRDGRHWGAFGTIEVRLIGIRIGIRSIVLVKVDAALDQNLVVVFRLVILDRRRIRGRLRCTALASLGQSKLRSLLAQNSLARQLDPVALDRQHLHQNLVALAKFILHFLHAMLRNLRHVQQSICAWEYLHERAKLRDANHLAQVGLANLRDRSNIRNHLDRARQSIGIARSHVHPAGVIHIDLHAGRIDDPANHLAARSDQIANLVGRNLNRVDARCKLRLLFARMTDRRIHNVQKMQPALLGLGQRLAHNLRRDAHDLDVHL